MPERLIKREIPEQLTNPEARIFYIGALDRIQRCVPILEENHNGRTLEIIKQQINTALYESLAIQKSREDWKKYGPKTN